MDNLPSNWKQLENDVKLASYPLKLDELKEALDQPGCHPDIWTLHGNLTPLHRLVRYCGTGDSIDDNDAFDCAKLYLDRGANMLHMVRVSGGTNTVLETAKKYLDDKRDHYPKLIELLKEADLKAQQNDAGNQHA